MTVNLDHVRTDLAAFADDDEEVVVDQHGSCMFVRAGREINIELSQDGAGTLTVLYNDARIPYRRFLSHELARLPVLAERILTKRAPVQGYVDSKACLDQPISEPTNNRALELLSAECTEHPAFASRVTFVTADAGQGKTALLREFQYRQAQRFLADESPFLFWHVDLQGRQLLRLSEALMGDLGDLRVAGLWMPAVIALLRHRALVLAIDGFDELAAEQGSSDALGALALLVQQMGDSGTIVAASRRTFFDTDDYIRRARLFGRVGGGDSEFDQMSLQLWQPEEGRLYFHEIEVDGKKFDDPDATYAELADQLGEPGHPMITRPFLLAQIARGLLLYGATPADFIKGMEDPMKGVGEVIRAFVKREVTEKWKQQDTGEPFLTEEQHLRLLADVAEEMFRGERTTIEIDVLEALTTLLLDEWQIEPSRQPQIIEMVRMHVLLTRPDDDESVRSFDHEQFQDWFTAYALKEKIEQLARPEGIPDHTLLSVAHLSDATALYVCGLIDRSDPERVELILRGLGRLLQSEWRPSYLQTNAGTLIPFLIDGVETGDWLSTPAGAVYSSLVFEQSRLRKVRINGATFVNVNLANVMWQDVVLEDCELGQLGIDGASNYSGIELRNCHIDGLRLLDEEESREYAPERIASRLGRRGWVTAKVEDELEQESQNDAVAGEVGPTRKLVNKILSVFRRTTFMPEGVIKVRMHQEARYALDEILPLMEREGVVERRAWSGSGGRQRAWGLMASLDEINRADGNPGKPFSAFWEHIDELDATMRRK
ncbi:MAG: hypothetical protein JWN10_1168 [Solirubrobacterales bacterium]|nr:hypothetical protein [Solirubrobacterales bacterium]